MATLAVVGGLAVAGIGAGMSASAASKSKKALGKIANTPVIDFRTVQQNAIGSAILNFNDVAKLGGQINSFNQQQLLQMRNAAYGPMIGKAEGVINSYLSGQIPDDVAGAIQRASAGKAVAGGYGGTGMHRNLQLRDLGLTSLQMTQQGLDSATRWLAATQQMSVPNLWDVTSMFIDPSTAYSGAIQQRGQNMGAATTAAAAPGASAVAGNFLQALGGTIATAGFTGTIGAGAGSAGGASGVPMANSIRMRQEAGQIGY